MIGPPMLKLKSCTWSTKLRNLKPLARSSSVRLLACQPDAVPPNLGIASVGTSGAILGPGFPCGIRVEVQNHGASARHGSRVTLSVDGESQPAQVIDIGARGRAEAVFTVAFKDAGEQGISGTLITLTGVDDMGQPVTRTATTAADGSYKFDRLRPGVTVDLAFEPTINEYNGFSNVELEVKDLQFTP